MTCLLRTTYCFLSFKKSCKRLSKFPDIPPELVQRWYHHVISYEMYLIYQGDARKFKLHIKQFICLMRDKKQLINVRIVLFKIGLIWDNKFLFNKKIKHFVKQLLFKNFSEQCSNNTGWQFISVCLSPSFRMETLIILYLEGKPPVSIHCLNEVCK